LKRLHDELDVFPDLFFGFGIPKEIGRVVGGHDPHPSEFMKFPPQRGDGGFGLKDSPRREAPQGTDDLRPYGVDLSNQKRFAGLHLILFRIAIPGRTTFQNIADVDVTPLKPHGLDDPCQKLAGPSDEGSALKVLFLARRLADKNQAGGGIPFAENQVPARKVEGASLAVSELPADIIEGPDGRRRPRTRAFKIQPFLRGCPSTGCFYPLQNKMVVPTAAPPWPI